MSRLQNSQIRGVQPPSDPPPARVCHGSSPPELHLVMRGAPPANLESSDGCYE